MFEKLRPMEQDIVRLASEGWGDDEIGRRLHIASGTVKFHLSLIYRLLDIPDRMVKRVVLTRWYLVPEAREGPDSWNAISRAENPLST
jgi:DNA-binding NarL/FixJ family response regulator